MKQIIYPPCVLSPYYLFNVGYYNEMLFKAKMRRLGGYKPLWADMVNDKLKERNNPKNLFV